MKASDLFVKCLETEGVTKIFGIPGEENADLMISLKKSKIEFVLCRHEQAAAFMADVYGRLTGKAGVCLATLGPGVTNLMTGLADANMDRAPVVAIIGQGSTERLHKESHQIMDSISMVAPISKWAQTILSAKNVSEVVRKAFKVAETEKPGVTVIELPEDVAKEEVNENPIKPILIRRPAADNRAVNEAIDLIISAKNPIILAGNGTIRKRASHRLRALVQNLGVGVINTFMGKGSVSSNDEHSLFTIGLGSGDYNNLAIDESDLVIAIGYDLVEYSPSAWNRIEKGQKNVIHIDYTPAEVDRNYLPNVEIIADLAGALYQLNNALVEKVGEKNLPLFKIKSREKARTTMLNHLNQDNDDDSFPMKPQRVLSDVRKVMDGNDIVLSDVGAHKMWVAREYNCTEPNTCLISNGFCTMGFALPGSMGAKMVFPDRKILSINGDAGFFMNVQDLETAVREKLNVVAVVWLDGEYGLIKWKQQIQFDGDHSDLKFDNPNFGTLAKSLNMWGTQINSAKDFLPALEEAFKQKGPAIIGVPVDYSENMRLTKHLGKVSAIL
ncbi:MAG: acetolactate synthase large subunit [alpha proteobacterium MED-G10]|nr:MAG: acetolactate synthase large subunit [alpha proteobacterium MED-G10]